jgi:hypothetical protein
MKLHQVWRVYGASVVFGAILVCGVIFWTLGLRYADAERTDHAITALGILVGGGWTFYQFILRKAFESALSIDYSVRTEPRKNQFAVFFEVIFANIGNRRITAPFNLTEDQVIDYEHSIEYPADLQVKRLADDFDGPNFVGWWSKSGALENIDGLPSHISLLFEYSRSDGKVDFFMEPKERYSLGSILVLPAGHYAAKIVFVGERAQAAEFWGRIVYFCVPGVRANHTGALGQPSESDT